MTSPNLVLMCHLCEWSPRDGMEMENIRIHFIEKHQTEKVELQLVAMCPRDDTKLDLRMSGVRPSDGNIVETFDCPKCLRSYRVVRKP